MKYILLCSFLFTQICFAQKSIRVVDYVVKHKNVYNQFAGKDNTFYISLSTKKDLGKQKYLMEMTVQGLDSKNINETDYAFSTRNLNEMKDFLNSTGAIVSLYLLKRPFEFTVDRGSVNIDTVVWKDDIKKQLLAWEIKEEVLEGIVNYTFYDLSSMVSSFFFSGLRTENLNTLKGDTFTNKDITYRIKDRNRKDMLVQYEKSDSVSTTEGTVRFDLHTGLVKVMKRGAKYQILQQGGSVARGEDQFSIRHESAPKMESFDSDYLDMLVKGSYWSEALLGSDGTDSTKFWEYVAKYEPRYGKNKRYIIAKLDGLQNVRNHDLHYNEALKDIAPSSLVNTHHLSNKLDVNGISDEDYQETISLMDPQQLYFYIQYFFGQSILSGDQVAYQRLEKIAAQQTKQVKIAALPLYLWAQSRTINDTDSIRDLYSQVLALDTPYWDQGNAGRYALMLQKMLIEKGNHNLEDIEVIINKIIPLYKDEKSKNRYIQKAHLAYANYLAYEVAAASGSDRALWFLEQAAFYSPKSQEEKAYGSFYDRVFLKSKENYSEDYFAELNKQGKGDVVLQQFVQEFLLNPSSSYNAFKAFYAQSYGEDRFPIYFREQVIPQLPNAPSFLLKDLDDNDFSSEQLKGKWTVIDFWGTWCGPCVSEMPELNKYYLNLKQDKNSKIRFLSIACHDTKQKVQKFLTNNNYEIPVLMSDERVQVNYKVQGYPSKYIITPEGKVISTPFGFDWKNFVVELVNL